jgi:GNAT superfamily N-acetyltransferase
MYYRLSGRAGDPPADCTRAQANRARFKALVDAGEFTGLVGYRGSTPVGWVSFGPREVFRKLARSPVMKPVDDLPVWSVICFVVPARYRGQGVAHALLRQAVVYAKTHGACMLEGYPFDRQSRASDESMWFGAKSMFDAAGFDEVARRRPTRPIVRLRLA